MTTEEQLKAIAQKYNLNPQAPLSSGDDLSSLRTKLLTPTPVFTDTPGMQGKFRNETVNQETSQDIKQIGTDVVDSLKARNLKIEANKARNAVFNNTRTAPTPLSISTTPDATKSFSLTPKTPDNQTDVRTGIQNLGQVLGFGADVIESGIKGGVKAVLPQKNEEKVKENLALLYDNPIVKPIVDKIPTEELSARFNQWKLDNPNKAADLDAIGGFLEFASNFVGAEGLSAGTKAVAPTLENVAKQTAKGALDVVGDVVTSGADTVANVAGKTKSVTSSILPTRESAILEIVTPELSAKKTGQAIRSGRGQVDTGTIFDTVSITPDSKITKAYEAVKEIVDPSKTVTENINTVRNALSTEAEALKSKISDVPTIFTFKELNSALKKVDLPISFKEDAQSKVLKKVTDAAMKIAKDKGGKIDSLLDARKEFDRLVEENFPNLYEAGKPTPTYNAITKTRSALNDFIESKLPEGFGYKESLRKQSAFYDALDAMETKAAKEVGAPTNKIIRKAKQVMKNNPKTTRVLKYGASGAAVLGGAKAILGD